jgi:hypothetical protein
VKLTARIATMFETAGVRRNGNGRAATPSTLGGGEGTGARSGRSLNALAGALLASAALLLALTAPPANAATATDSYGYLTSFGSAEARQIEPAFNAITTDQTTGNILITEGNLQRIQIYSPDPTLGGVPLANLNVEAAGYIPSSVAFDQSDGALYLLTFSPNRIVKFVSDGAPVPTYSEDTSFSPPILPFAPLGGLAVDPVTHDVLVGSRSQGSSLVYSYDQTGAFVSSFDGSNTTAGAFSNVGALAAGPGGTIYVVDDAGHRVERFSSTGASLGALPISAGGSPTNIAVNPQSGESVVRVNRGGQFFLEGFTAAGLPIFSAHIPAQTVGGNDGLAWDAGTDRIYLGSESGTVYTFVPAKQPGLDTPVVSQITPTGAHLEAQVAPGGEVGETTKAGIEYCPATATCSEESSWVPLTEYEGLSGGEVTIKDDLEGLAPNSEYLVRDSADRTAANQAQTVNTSATTSFSTPLIAPEVHTGLAGGITDTAAQLTGTIATFGDQTTYHFEYGLTTNYGSSAPVGAEGVAGNERVTRTFVRTLTGLQPGTTYHYRLVARNSAGKAEGEDHTFTTVGADEVALGRAYEQVSPVDKRGSALRVETFQASADGSGIVYAGAAASSDGESAPVLPMFLSRREPSDWSEWQPLDPPLAISRPIIAYATQAVSADLDHAFVVSNRALVPGAIDEGANIYIRDLRTGVYTLVGSAKGLAAYSSMNGGLPPNNYLAGAPDFSWVILASKFPLLPGVTGAQIYKWTETGGLELESRLPGPNGGGVPDSELPQLPGKDTLRWPVASEDGNTVYFSFLGGPDAGVYRRENGQTTAISVSQIPGGPATPAAGQFDGTSSDGRYGFFRSSIRLTTGAPETLPAGANAYLYRFDAVTEGLTYIGPAVQTDFGRIVGISDDGQTISWNGGAAGTFIWHDGTSHLVTAFHIDAGANGAEGSLSGNGRYLAYLESGDVYLYNVETDQRACVSCRPDGSPGGTADLQLHDRSLDNRVPQVLTDDGTVFFDTAVPLVPADHNGKRDVYSYHGGALTLISPGDGNFTASFADASADGSNIFFLTDEPLVNQDTNGELDLYDARIGGGFPAQSPPPPPASCLRSDCGVAESGPLTSPPVGSSQSQSAAKSKNHCPKGTHARKVKGRTQCVKPSKHKKKSRNAKRADTNRRQGR